MSNRAVQETDKSLGRAVKLKITALTPAFSFPPLLSNQTKMGYRN